MQNEDREIINNTVVSDKYFYQNFHQDFTDNNRKLCKNTLILKLKLAFNII